MSEFNIYPMLPEIVLLSAVSVIMIIDLFLDDQQRHISYWLTHLTLLGCAAVTLATWPVAGAPQIVHTFNNLFVDDWMSDVLKLSAYVTVSLTLFYGRDYLKERGLFTGEFFSLALFSLLGIMVMISANHMLTLYLGLELMALPTYALVALQRDRRQASEAAMKYFLLGALASGLLPVVLLPLSQFSTCCLSWVSLALSVFSA